MLGVTLSGRINEEIRKRAKVTDIALRIDRSCTVRQSVGDPPKDHY